jgi:zinc transport system substrate-binding protein
MRLILILIFGMLVLCAVGCGRSDSPGSPAKETVVASFYPLAYAAEEIGNGRVDVSNLTPAGAEPHDLEVSPQDVAAIREADLVLLLGRGFQPQLEDAAGTGKNVLRLLDIPGLQLRPDGDPHVWLDPLRYAKIVERIGEALHHPAATARLQARLRVLDGEYRTGLSH